MQLAGSRLEKGWCWTKYYCLAIQVPSNMTNTLSHSSHGLYLPKTSFSFSISSHLPGLVEFTINLSPFYLPGFAAVKQMPSADRQEIWSEIQTAVRILALDTASLYSK